MEQLLDQKPSKPSKALQKLCKYRERLEFIKSKRKKKKEDRKKRIRESVEHADNDDRQTKKQKKDIVRQKCLQGLRDGQKICLDLSYEDMSDKERSRLAQQLGRIYGSNRKYDKPAHLYFTGFKKDGELYKECIQKHEGFADYMIDMKEECFLETFTREQLVYLSPDSKNVLSTVDPDKVYVIGGIVEEFITKYITTQKATEKGLATARLPITEYMMKSSTAAYNKPLAINHVFDILMTYTETLDWRKALPVGVAKRHGYVVKPVDTSSVS